jgi:ribosomal-protein-alanine N-acetyltransferase
VSEVTRAGAADLPRLARLAADALQDGWSGEALAAELARPDARVWVVREDGTALGFVCARRILDELHVLALAVEPAHRRRGLARALLAALLAGEAGVREVQLEVRAGNAPARAFYADAGFVAVGRRPRYYRGGEDAVLLSRGL